MSTYLWWGRSRSGNGSGDDPMVVPYRQLERRQLGLMTDQIAASGVPAYASVFVGLIVAGTLAAPSWLIFLLVCRIAMQALTMRTAEQLGREVTANQVEPGTVRKLIGYSFFSAFSWAMLTWPLEVGTQFELTSFLIITIALFAVSLSVIAAAHHAAALNAATLGGFLGLLPKIIAVTPEIGPILLISLFVLMATIWNYGLLLHRQSRGALVLHSRMRSVSQRLEQTNGVLQETLRRAEHLADHDALTGLRNRRAFERDLVSFQARFAHRQRQLMLLDIDHFKRINDRFGHETGDGVLLAIGTCLGHWANESSDRMVGRWGGEEFIVSIALRPNQRLNELLEELRLRVEYLSDQLHWPEEISLSTSIGCAPLAMGEALEVALREADRALYAAKDAGRNCWRIAA